MSSLIRLSLLLVVVCFATSSCAMNQHKKAFSYFRESQKAFDKFDVDASVMQAHRFVQEGAKRCYAKKASPMMMPSGAGGYVIVPGAEVAVAEEPISAPGLSGMSTRVAAGNDVNYVPMFQVDIVQLAVGSAVTIYYEYREQQKNGRQKSDVTGWIGGDLDRCSKKRK